MKRFFIIIGLVLLGASAWGQSSTEAAEDATTTDLTPEKASDLERMVEMMNAIDDKDWARASSWAQAAEDEIIIEIYNWHALRGGEGRFEAYETFLDENAEWPGLAWLQARGEINMPAGLNPQRVIDFIDHHGPQTGIGLWHYLEAYKSLGQDRRASEIFAREAKNVEMTPNVMSKIKALRLNGFSDSLYLYADHAVWEREYENVNTYLSELSAADAEKIRTRLAILRGESREGGEGGAAFDQFEVALKNARKAPSAEASAENQEASQSSDSKPTAQVQPSEPIDIILRASTSREGLGEPQYWAPERADLARSTLWNGDPETAYEIAAYHYLNPDEKGYADLEFLAGFIAIDFLFNREAARDHFQNLKDAVNTPISNGRAGYWLGRAGDPTGYGYGAKWQTSFYGQLSAEKLGGLYDENLIAPVEDVDYEKIDIEGNDNLRAALYFYNADRYLLARRFFAHESETRSPEEAELLARFVYDLGQYDTAVNIGKNLALRAEVIPSYYPIPPYLTEKFIVPAPLALSIARQESEFYPRAESHVGARGLMQLMPATAELMSEELEYEYDIEALLDNPQYNIALGTAYIHEMLITFDGQLPLAVLSYNAGPGRGVRWRRQLGELGETPDEVVHWLEQIPFDETRNYVQRVLEGTFLYSAKLQESYDDLAPSILLTEPYPEGVDYAAIKRERMALEEERKRIEAEALERAKAAGEVFEGVGDEKALQDPPEPEAEENEAEN